MLLADGAGYFATVAKQFGTKISFDISPSGGPPEEAQFLGGSDQWMGIGLPSSLPAMIQGKDQLAVFNLGLSLGTSVLGAQRYEATKGTNIAAYGDSGIPWCDVTPIGTATTIIRLVAAKYHITRVQGNLISVGTGAAELPALKSGRCAIIAGDGASAVTSHAAYVVSNTVEPGPTIALAGEQTGIAVFTSRTFAQKYPELTQAMTDALVKALSVIQTNRQNPELLYSLLPSILTKFLPYATFAAGLQLSPTLYDPKYNDGTYPLQEINDSWLLNEAAGVIPIGSAMDPSQNFANKFAIQAYSDLGITRPAGAQNGPAELPTAVGMPSLEMANAFAALTGRAVPANDGPSPLGKP
ncbi:MAG TPA: hypothetical protein VK816_07155 [Jatrophihabitantaceae bacterium]|nr:hypothetical protein [Jatrophihabitantaceae bacterium]